MLKPAAPGKRASTFAKFVALPGCLALGLGIAGAFLHGARVCAADAPPTGAKSIFDDDFKPPPSMPAPKPPPVTPPTAPPPPRLAPPKPPEETPKPPPPAPTEDPAKPPVVTPIVPEKARPAGRFPTPNAAALAAAEKIIKDVFKADYADHTQAGQMALARAFLSEVQQNPQAPPTLYVLLREARELAIACGDPATAVDAVRGLRDVFEIKPAEAWQMEHAVLGQAIRSLMALPPTNPAPPEMRDSILLAMAMAERDLAAGVFGYAADMAAVADQVARRSYDASLLERVHERAALLGAIAAEFDRNKESFTALGTHPDDPAANFAVGRFYTLIANRPAAGLPMLAKGSDPALRLLAAKDLANPADPIGQLALADAWAGAAKITMSGLYHDGLQNRALYWYDLIASKAKGLTQAAVARRAAELRTTGLKRGLLGQYFRGEDFGFPVFSHVDPYIDFNWSSQPPDASLPSDHYSVRWHGWLRAPMPGNYKIVIIHDDGARVWLDGKPIVDMWRPGASRETVPVTLTGNLQELRVDYAQQNGTSTLGLGWIIPKGTRARAIPNECLFHEVFSPGPVIAPPPHPGPDGVIPLPAACADIHSPYGARYVQNPKGDFIGFWGTSALTWLSWQFDAPEGDYDVSITDGCDGGNAGSEYQLSVGNNRLPGKVVDTGGMNNFRATPVGRIHLVPGGQTLRLTVLNKPKASVMNLNQIVLTPVKAP